MYNLADISDFPNVKTYQNTIIAPKVVPNQVSHKCDGIWPRVSCLQRLRDYILIVPVNIFFTANCIKGSGQFYQGHLNVTQSGIECQPWFTDDPHVQTTPPKGIFPEMRGSKNYCRNPGGTEPVPWCYTKDPMIRWQHCGLQRCGKNLENVMPLKLLRISLFRQHD